MSDLRDSLGRWAEDRGQEVARAVSVHEGETRAAASRRRARNLTTTTAVAVLGLVGASALVVAGPWGAAQPAQPLPTEPVDLAELTCGAPWVLGSGSVTHDGTAPEYFGGIPGRWVKLTDGGDVIENPDGIEAGWESVTWTGEPTVRGNVAMEGIVVAERDGVIVGSAAPDFRRFMGYELDGVTFSGAYPGNCGNTVEPREDGDYTYHVVIQATLVGETDTVLQTIIDPNGPLTVEVSGLEELSQSSGQGSDVPAKLFVPRGDRFQAFVVPRPSPGSCTPYSDMIAQGVPTDDALQYEVTIPGVQALTGEIWGNGPLVVIDDEDYQAWYVGLATAVTAQRVDGGDPLAPLEWTTGPSVGEQTHEGELRLVNTWEAVDPGPPRAGCAFTAPLPALDGAVFLIIDGVDSESLAAAYPGADVVLPENAQTWVYLGQAGAPARD